MKEVFLLSVKTPDGRIPLAIFSTKPRAEAFAKVLVIDYSIMTMPVDAWTVVDKEA